MENETTEIISGVTSTTPSYTIYIVICLIILLVVGALIVFRRYKKNKIPKEIPQEVLNEFNRAEELSRKYKGSVTPQAILWQVNEEREGLFTLKKDEYKNTSEEIPIQSQSEKPKLKYKFKWK